MVIKKAEDIYTLVDERIEAMEDLNCEELSVCVKSFINAALLLTAMEIRKEIYAEEERIGVKKMAKDQFVGFRDKAWAYIHTIDQLTLRTDTAE